MQTLCMAPISPAMADRRIPDAGVTLIEILAVLVIIGISAGVVTLALPGRAPSRGIAQEAELLQSRLNLAAERSLIAARYMRLDWGSDGYGFEVWDGERWEAAGDRKQIEFSLSDANGSRAGEVLITPDGISETGRVTLLRLGTGTSQRSVRFDGARASVSP